MTIVWSTDFADFRADPTQFMFQSRDQACYVGSSPREDNVAVAHLLYLRITPGKLEQETVKQYINRSINQLGLNARQGKARQDKVGVGGVR